MITYKQVLKEYFGYDSFRDGQEYIINSILNGRDCLGIMPTGAGKSICFQVPALMKQGITIVISPLISLMKDQVNSLNQVGIPAAYINSSLTEKQIAKVFELGQKGAYKLIYVAPERLLTADFINFSSKIHIDMITVDEAHCISQWGQDFRPSYASIPEFVDNLTYRPILSAFTATATAKVRDDILDLLHLQSPATLVTGFDRKNLYFGVQKPKDKFVALLNFIKDKKEKAGIVYCSTRNTVEEVCEKLIQSGYNASRYHAGLSDAERHKNQDDFLYDRINIMVATNAFGMGIDKSNVSYVVHYNMPKDIESYYQESGRAGRDGENADCILLYSGQDVRTNLWLIENGTDSTYANEETEALLKERDRQRLRDMTFYCTTTDCLRAYILKYFGETPPNFCGNCSNCNTIFEDVDVTIDAQKVISCVCRMNGRFGVSMVIDVLRGSKSKRIAELGLDKLSTYGICEKSVKNLHDIINHLILCGYLIKTNDKYPVITTTNLSANILKGGEKIVMKLQKENEKSKKINTEKQKNTAYLPVDTELFNILRQLRSQIAAEQGVPAFVVFSDSTLTDMCRLKPQSDAEMLNVSGVGQKKNSQYGKRFLQLISEYGIYNKNTDTEENVEYPPLDISSIEISDSSQTISIIADKINAHLMQCGYKTITGAKINDYLISKGYLEKITEDNTNYKVTTEQGMQIGITTKEIERNGRRYKQNSYSCQAQEFIISHLMDIIEFSAQAKKAVKTTK